jgi:nucleotide-binding universal stress UspA family protein
MEKKFMKVLLAVDGSPCSEAAVAEVAARPWPAGSEFSVVSAYQLPMSPTPEAWAIPPEYYNEMEQAVRSQAQKAVDLAAAQLQQTLDKPAAVLTQVLVGSPQSVILEEADRWQADLIVVGSHGYGPWQRLVLGSVSQAVVLHAKCSVEVVRRCQKATSAEAA